MYKLSIIIPVYNTGIKIKKCITSLIEQTYSNYEVIIINDGSTDNSEQIIKSLISQDNRFYLFNTVNNGVAYARNYGIKKSTGDLLFFIDSDDWISNDYLYNMISNYQNEDFLINTSVVYKYENNTEKKWLNEKYSKDIIISTLKNKCLNYVWGKLYKKSIIEKYNIYFESLTIAEDVLFNVNYSMNIESYHIINKSKFYYYQHSSSATKNHSLNNYISRLNSILLIKNTLEKKYKKKYKKDVSFLFLDLFFIPYMKIHFKFNKKNRSTMLTLIKKNNELLSWKCMFFSKSTIKRKILFTLQYIAFKITS
ncbi:glycosyltransferase family 2 protein [Proteus terrae]|uniref:glycosyltransferase family 2 protein n=1 Tax=Proteus terrae TaxID=1574161 RepID=UPI001C601596|nr:glycosyltransferase family 2 protein [Proteus terrae]